MAISTKIIRRRIRSIKNTRKVTKAMELVSASKMRRAVNSVLMSRAYAQMAWQVVLNISKRISPNKHPLLRRRNQIKNVCTILISSNRGLCGGFNVQVINRAINFIATRKKDQAFDDHWVVMGKKAGEYLSRSKKNIIADFLKPDIIAGLADVSPLAKMITEDYVSGKFDQVVIAYTDFVSALNQKAKIKILLPFAMAPDEELGSVKAEESMLKSLSSNQEPSYDEEYLFEPNPEMVLDIFLKKLIEVQLYQAVLESTASEHASRMISMRQASDAAADLMDELTLAYNQARQAAITREIAEISSGKAALE